MALKGNVRFSDYQFILAHPDIMPELLALRGLLKKKFPSPKSETLGLDVPALVSKFMSGIFISGKRDEHQENFGLVETSLGRVRNDDSINRSCKTHSNINQSNHNFFSLLNIIRAVGHAHRTSHR